MENQQFDVVITSHTYSKNLKELLRYKDLIVMFVKRNFTIMYKQTILGPAWILLNPFITSVVFTFIFGQLAGISTDGTPQFLFYMAGNCLWGIIASTVAETSRSLINNSSMFSKVYFPRLVIPASQIITAIFNFFIQLSMFFIFYIWFFVTGSPIAINPIILLLPIVLLQVSALGLGVGMIVAALTTKYRDLAIAVGFGIQIWMYITPIVYPYSSLGGWTKLLVGLNPATMPMEIFRYGLMGSGMVDYKLWGLSILMTIAILALGIKLFNKIERTFVDTI